MDVAKAISREVDITAEQSVLGSILISSEMFLPVVDIINADDFQDSRHRIIFQSMSSLLKKGQSFDLLNLSEELKSAGKLRNIGGRTYLVDLMACVPVASHAVEYAHHVKEKSIRAKLLTLSRQLGEDVTDETRDLSVALSTVSEIVSNSSSTVSKTNPVVEYEQWERQYREGASRGLLGLSTGIQSVDNLTFGFMPGHFWVLGAYRANGKTFLGLNFVNSILNQGRRAVIISLEMSSNELIQRLIGIRAGLDLLDVIGNEPPNKTEVKMRAKEFIFQMLIERKLIIHDEPMSMDRIYWALKRDSVGEGIDFMMLDYIQLIRGAKHDKHEDTADAANSLQQITKELNCTSLILSQISNEAQKAGFDSDVDGFKDAGEISANANVAIRLFRIREEGSSKYTDDLKLSFKKIRHGITGDLDLKIRFPGGRVYNPHSALLEDV